ncbi:MAG: ATP-binding protein [Myxococcota bacterium]
MSERDEGTAPRRLLGPGYVGGLQADLLSSELSLAFLRSLFAQASQVGLGFFEIEPKTSRVHMDVNAARLFVSDSGLADGRSAELAHFLAIFEPELRSTLERGLAHGQSIVAEGRLLGEGTPLYVSVTLGAEGGRFFGLLQDTTVHRREMALAQNAQRLESIGRLAGGVAHDFNNLLTTILGSAELLMDESDPEEIQALAEEIVAAGDRGRELTKRLLTLSHRQEGQRKKTDLPAWIRASVDPWRRLMDAGVRLDLDLPTDRLVSWVDPHGLEQVMHNLLVNARDATEGGGQIEISLELSGPPPGGSGSQWCTLRVSDDGPGMDPEVQARVLEPFFTTKAVGEGTGLGLSSSFAIIRGFGGHLEVDSRPGRGTHVRMWLPLTEQEPTDDLPERLEIAPRRHSILVLEDDRAVGLTMAKMLERLGFSVVLVHDEAGAFEAVRSRRIDLLVSDVVMPQTTGPEVVKRLKAEFPQLRVLFVSGYAGGELERHGWDPQTPLLAKPFTADALLARIAEQLPEA